MGLLAGLGATGAASLFAPGRVLARPTGTRIGDAAEVSELEAQFDPALRMMGRASVNGRGPFQFVIDTGANRTAIAEDLANRLGLPRGPEVELHGIAGMEITPTARVDAFEVGGLVSRGMLLPVLKRHRVGADGLMGLDALAGRLVELDFRRRRVRLRRSRPTTYGISKLTPEDGIPGEILPARYRFGQLTLVQVRSGLAPITAFIDSGSQVTVGNSALKRLVRLRNLARDEVERRVPIFSVTSQVAFGELTILKTLEIGDSRILNLPVVFSDVHAFRLWGLQDTPALLIGADTLARFSMLVLDFGRKQVRFNP